MRILAGRQCTGFGVRVLFSVLRTENHIAMVMVRVQVRTRIRTRACVNVYCVIMLSYGYLLRSLPSCFLSFFASAWCLMGCLPLFLSSSPAQTSMVLGRCHVQVDLIVQNPYPRLHTKGDEGANTIAIASGYN